MKTKLIRHLKKKTCPELVSGDGSPKTKTCPRNKFGAGSELVSGELKPTVMNTVFLDLTTSIEDCVKVIKAFNRLGYMAYYDSKTKTLKTTAPKTRIKEFSKLFKCIQSYSLIQRQ